MLNKPALYKDIFELLSDMETREVDSKAEFADRLSTAIDLFVKSGTVQVNPGIPVSTAGTAVAQTGATTGPGTGKMM